MKQVADHLQRGDKVRIINEIRYQHNLIGTVESKPSREDYFIQVSFDQNELIACLSDRYHDSDDQKAREIIIHSKNNVRGFWPTDLEKQ